MVVSKEWGMGRLLTIVMNLIELFGSFNFKKRIVKKKSQRSDIVGAVTACPAQ